MTRTLVISMALLMTGCATVFSGTTEEVSIRTQPPGAHVTIKVADKVIHEGNAPWEGTLGKRFPVMVTARAPGFLERTVEYKRKRTGWYIANISTLMFCWIGFIVDRKNGSAWVFQKKELMVVLNPDTDLPEQPAEVTEKPPDEKKPPPAKPPPPPPEKKPDKPKVLTED